MSSQKRHNRFSNLQFAIKVLAAFSALIPFMAGLVQLKQSLTSPKMQLLMDDRRFFIAISFGVAFAATNDIAATATAIVLAMLLFNITQEDPDGDGDFSCGYGTVVGMDVNEAVSKVKRTSPALNVVKVKHDQVQPAGVAGRVQIIQTGQLVTGYVVG